MILATKLVLLHSTQQQHFLLQLIEQSQSWISLQTTITNKFRSEMKIGICKAWISCKKQMKNFQPIVFHWQIVSKIVFF